MKPMRYVGLLLLVGLLPASGAEPKVGPAFEQMLVLDQGRVKPLDTYARTLLLRLSGRSRFEGMSASAWLALTK